MDPVDHALERLRRARSTPLRVIFPEGEDARLQQAAQRLASLGAGLNPLLVGNAAHITQVSSAQGIDISRIEIVDPATDARSPQLAKAYASRRQGTSEAVAARAMRKPLFFAGQMLATGEAEAMVAGATCPTARVIEAAMLTIGLETGVTAPSSFFIMQHSRGPYIFSDCAVNVSPDIETLAATGIASAASCKALLGLEPRVAFLSFSTHASASHDQARKVRSATLRAQELCPSVRFDGELQLDAALDPRVAAMKVKPLGEVAGRANVLVFPDLNAANIGYKLVQYLGGAKALGPFLQGFAAPVSDLSRGATVDDIVGTAILTASRALA
jgi:phosphate acetyltransferase